MKKLILLSVFIGLSLTASAQLKVDSDGRTKIGSYSSLPFYYNARLNVKKGTSDVYAASFTGCVKCDSYIEGRFMTKQTNFPSANSTTLPNALALIGQLQPYKMQFSTLLTNSGISSDESQNYENALKVGIRPVNYTYQIPAIQLLGIEEFTPYAGNGSEGQQLVDYVGLVPFLVQAINELQARIDSLQGLGTLRAVPESLTEEEAPSLQNSRMARQLSAASLMQNSPNPFSERTTIRFTLPDDARQAYIYIFDMTGKMLRQIPVDGTMQSVTINGYELSPGMYIYSLVVNGQEIDAKRMILSK